MTYMYIGLIISVVLVLSVGGYLGYLFVEDRWENSYIRNETVFDDSEGIIMLILIIIVVSSALVILWAPTIILGLVAWILIVVRAMRRVQKKVAKL